MLAWEWLPMTVARQGDVPHSPISLDAHHPQRPDGFTAWRRGNSRIVTVVLTAAVVIAAVIAAPKVAGSISRTMERVAHSAELQGRTGTDLMQRTVDALRPRH